MADELPEVPSAKGKGLAGKVMQWIVIIGVIAGGDSKELLFPDFFANKRDKAIIQEEVHKEILEIPKIMGAKYSKDSTIFASSMNRLWVENNRLKAQVNDYQELFEAIQRQTDFNTQAISITNDAILEEMDKKSTDCNYSYYETKKGDDWNVFDDYYNSRILYSIDKRSGCRVYYSPIFRSKIKIQ